MAQNFQQKTIQSRRRNISTFADFTGQFPWLWTPSDFEEYSEHLRGVRNLAYNTVRSYQTEIKLFLDYVTSPTQLWNQRCFELFGTTIAQIVDDTNRARHRQDSPESSKRPFSRSELQAFFDLADMEPERILNAGRKGHLEAWRNAVFFKTVYAWGLRHTEALNTRQSDFSSNSKAPRFGEYGLLRVRMGKGSRGSGPRVRTVLSVFGWATEALEEWAQYGWPQYGVSQVAPFFPTRTGQILDRSYINSRFRNLIDELGFAPGLDIHSLRRSYATDLQTVHGLDLTFVQIQLGHRSAATTAIYTIPSHDYRIREIERVTALSLERALATETGSSEVDR